MPPPGTGSCTGAAITGTLKDSLTSQPVAQGWVYLETGTPLAQVSTVYNFSVIQQATAGADGSFNLCASSIPGPSVLVAMALDASGNAYPPYVTRISGSANLSIPMGGCALLCGLDGQQQTSAPATISGTITTEPVAASGTAAATYAISALDGSSSVWGIAFPSLSGSHSTNFVTTAGMCPNKAPFCSSYSYVLPSQKPMVPTKTATVQQTGAPTYLINAVPGTASGCKPATLTAVDGQDGKPLTAAPGAQLSAQTISFGACN